MPLFMFAEHEQRGRELGKGREEGKRQASPFVGDEPRQLNLVRKETLLRLQKVATPSAISKPARWHCLTAMPQASAQATRKTGTKHRYRTRTCGSNSASSVCEFLVLPCPLLCSYTCRQTRRMHTQASSCECVKKCWWGDALGVQDGRDHGAGAGLRRTRPAGPRS
jgi:hypothetical protein